MRKTVTLCAAALLSWAVGAPPLRADEPPIQIRLGIRDIKYLSAKERIAYPLAFRIQNTGKKVIGEDAVIQLFFKGVVHVLPAGSEEQHTDVQPNWRTTAPRLGPDDVAEAPAYGNLLDFFPSLGNGRYRVWWTLEKAKSNVLRFTVEKGKLSLQSPGT